MELTRRAFLSSTAMAGTSLLINPQETMAQTTTVKAAPGYELLIFATNWGYNGSWKDFCTLIKKEGYDGAEVWCPSDPAQRDSLVATFREHGLKFGFLVGGWEKDFDRHFKQFEDSLRAAAKLQPVYINCHSGRDYYSFDQNKKFIDLTTAVNRESGVSIYHETHRSRILYSAPVSKQFMEQLPALRLTLDISHWCNVHESLLEDQQETVDLALSRSEHIHARIGHQEGPQVNDPRAPEWENNIRQTSCLVGSRCSAKEKRRAAHDLSHGVRACRLHACDAIHTSATRQPVGHQCLYVEDVEGEVSVN